MVLYNITNEVVLGDTIIEMHRRLDWLLPSWYNTNVIIYTIIDYL
jgi:hypothetical protein